MGNNKAKTVGMTFSEDSEKDFIGKWGVHEWKPKETDAPILAWARCVQRCINDSFMWDLNIWGLLSSSIFQILKGEFIVSCNSGIWTVGTAGPRHSDADIGFPSHLSSTLSSFSGMDPFPYLFQQMYHACAILPWQRSSAYPWPKWVFPAVLPKCPIQ